MDEVILWSLIKKTPAITVIVIITIMKTLIQ